jgi:hypothetical protein
MLCLFSPSATSRAYFASRRWHDGSASKQLASLLCLLPAAALHTIVVIAVGSHFLVTLWVPPTLGYSRDAADIQQMSQMFIGYGPQYLCTSVVSDVMQK